MCLRVHEHHILGILGARLVAAGRGAEREAGTFGAAHVEGRGVVADVCVSTGTKKCDFSRLTGTIFPARSWEFG